MNVEADHLLVFARIAAEGSVTRAAEALHRSQPALSQQMARLRQAVGDPLYLRTRYGVSLTPAGAALLPHAEALARALAGARSLAGAWRQLEQGRLAIAASTTVAYWWLPPPLARFAYAHPGVQISLLTRNSQDALTLLARGEAEIAIVEGPLDDAELPADTVRQEQTTDVIVLACRPDSPLAGPLPIQAATLTGMGLVRREPGSGTRQIVDRGLEGAAAYPTTQLEVTGVTGVVAAIRAGVAPGFVSRLAVADDIAAGRLVEVPLDDLQLSRSFTCLAPPDQLQSPAARTFITDLRQFAGLA
jgi:DNA-binding transcriptional LysR family regulator